MPVTTIDIANPRLDDEPRDFFSVTERICLPRKYPCITTEDNPLYGDDDSFACQVGCDEEPFTYIVEAGDQIQLQFQLPDYFNSNPISPLYGWYNGLVPSDWFVRLEVFDNANNPVFDGPISQIADAWYVGATDDGLTMQYALINVDRLLEQIGVQCFYFRVTIKLGVGEYLAINSASTGALPENVPIGYRWMSLSFPTSGHVYEWDGTTWNEIRPPWTDGEWAYIASLGTFYQYNIITGKWERRSTSPPSDEGAFQYIYTMSYRVRRCNEPVVRFRAVQRGVDCIGFIHDTPKEVYSRTFFQWDFKVIGSCEAIKLNAQRELTKNNRLTSVVEGMTARVRTTGLPQVVAYAIRSILASKEFYINEEQFDNATELQRNNDVGELWWLDFEVSRTDCDTSTTC